MALGRKLFQTLLAFNRIKKFPALRKAEPNCSIHKSWPLICLVPTKYVVKCSILFCIKPFKFTVFSFFSWETRAPLAFPPCFTILIKLLGNTNYKVIVMNVSQSHFFLFPYSYKNSRKDPLNWTKITKENLTKNQSVISDISPNFLLTCLVTLPHIFALHDFYLAEVFLRFQHILRDDKQISVYS
jgi:hypothetical protein